MLDIKGNVLYIGKAKNLKNRIKSYILLDSLSSRIRKMVSLIDSVEIVETNSEAEALILEANLIKQIKPKYNVKLKDDSSYPYIAIPNTNNNIPRIFRGNIRNVDDMLFGPFPNTKAAQKVLDLVIKIFKLRTCSNSEFKRRTKPCIRYDIDLCSAPCVGKISEEEYLNSLKQAQKFLKGEGASLIKSLEKKMSQASSKEHYEQAAVYRDRIKNLNAVLQSTSSAYYKNIKDADVWGLFIDKGKASVQLFMYRNGIHLGNKKISPESIEDKTEQEIMHYILALHYENNIPPQNIYCSCMPEDPKLLEKVFSDYLGKNVYINHPVRGDKYKIIKQAVMNAEGDLRRKMAQQQAIKKQFKNLSEILQMNKTIKRIEAFDVSNIQGKSPVASMVVATEEGMQPSQYRKFKIKSKETPDDYSMMEEALTRRYSRIKKENLTMPDVIFVDGGKGHLNVLIKVFEKLGLESSNVKLCAIAKGEFRDKGLEKIFQQNKKEPLPIDFNSDLIFLLQNIRDEAHRFAIGYHRKLRAKSIMKSPLDEIEGIGPIRKKALINYFGGLEGLKNATIEDILKVEGINLKLAEIIYHYLKQ